MSTCPDPTSCRQPDFLDAKASLALLGVRPQTLYAYVSWNCPRMTGHGLFAIERLAV